MLAILCKQEKDNQYTENVVAVLQYNEIDLVQLSMLHSAIQSC